MIALRNQSARHAFARIAAGPLSGHLTRLTDGPAAPQFEPATPMRSPRAQCLPLGAFPTVAATEAGHTPARPLFLFTNCGGSHASAPAVRGSFRRPLGSTLAVAGRSLHPQPTTVRSTDHGH